MKQIRRKLFLSIFMLFVTAVTLTSTTLAWFARNQEAWTDEFELEIENTDGLLISIDGVNFYSDVNNDELMKAITAKKLGKSVKDVTDAEVKANVTNLSSVTTKDLNTFTTVDNASAIKDGFYEHHIANKDNYVVFDLYFKTQTSKNQANKNYTVQFVNSLDEAAISYIKANDADVKLHNKLNSILGEYGPAVAGKEVITVNPANAMRIGVTHHENVNTIYEPYDNLGSYALKDAQEDIYNPDKNAMLTYFNNTHNTKLAPLDNLDVYKNTEKDFDGNVNFGTIVPNSDKTDYVPIKITVAIWLEGMDADYFVGVDSNSIKIFLNFSMKEVI